MPRAYLRRLLSELELLDLLGLPVSSSGSCTPEQQSSQSTLQPRS
jgi:hypothetical protein